MSDYILYEVDGSVAMITLNRPERMNAMDQSMLRQLIAAAERAEADEDIRAVVSSLNSNRADQSARLVARGSPALGCWRALRRPGCASTANSPMEVKNHNG